MTQEARLCLGKIHSFLQWKMNICSEDWMAACLKRLERRSLKGLQHKGDIQHSLNKLYLKPYKTNVVGALVFRSGFWTAVTILSSLFGAKYTGTGDLAGAPQTLFKMFPIVMAATICSGKKQPWWCLKNNLMWSNHPLYSYLTKWNFCFCNCYPVILYSACTLNHDCFAF